MATPPPAEAAPAGPPAAPPPVALPRTGAGAAVDTSATPAMLVGAVALTVLIALASALRRRRLSN